MILRPIPTAFDPADDPLAVATPTCCCCCCCCCLVSVGTTATFLGVESYHTAKRNGRVPAAGAVAGVIGPAFVTFATAMVMIQLLRLLPDSLTPLVELAAFGVFVLMMYYLYRLLGFDRAESVLVPVAAAAMFYPLLIVDLISGLNDKPALELFAPVGMLTAYGLVRLHLHFRKSTDQPPPPGPPPN